MSLNPSASTRTCHSQKLWRRMRMRMLLFPGAAEMLDMPEFMTSRSHHGFDFCSAMHSPVYCSTVPDKCARHQHVRCIKASWVAMRSKSIKLTYKTMSLVYNQFRLTHVHLRTFADTYASTQHISHHTSRFYQFRLIYWLPTLIINSLIICR